ncbi:MAG: hypothetical protein NTU49_09575 [Gammaproteobacteria bacterium]|nr:hypothetical protein [Gammaproteobacteria bacterium]
MKIAYKAIALFGLAFALAGCGAYPYNYYPPVNVTAPPAASSMNYGPPPSAASSMNYGPPPSYPSVTVSGGSEANSMHYGN